ncbi:LOW QUALITY PROTEIN: Protein CBG12782, partial [Caenorhabditis briggsae]
MYDSTEDEKGEKTSDEEEHPRPRPPTPAVTMPSTSNSQTQTVQLPLTRRERALSSSSNESSTYMPTLPSSVFHAPSGTRATRQSSTRGSQVVCFSATGNSRLRNTNRDGDDRSAESIWQMEQIMELIEQTHNRRSLGPELPNLPLSSIMDRRASSNIRKSYYYPMKIMFPKAQSFNLKVDRMSVDRLFDRNHTIWSLIFDIVLATTVSLLAVLVIDARIFYDYSLVAFCFVVASAQFSLLKSVQPDASSPIHGFNWIASYNRPIYFCIMALGLLYVHHVADGKNADENQDELMWNWNPFRFYMMPNSSILIALRDLFSILLLLLPVAFTLGWLPQFNTLAHHVAEQLEMHIFGGTASFSVFSACVQLAKSSCFYVALCVLCRFAYTFSPNSTQNPMFSAFVATSVAVSYLLSRMSSNQNLTVILFDILIAPFRKKSEEEVEEEEAAANTPSISTARDEMPKMVRKTVGERARYDLIFSIFLIAFFFGLHSTSLFTATQPYFTYAITGVCVFFGVINHYLFPQFRSHTPWRAVSSPLLKSAEHSQFESPEAAKLMYFEAIHLWMVAIERNIAYPLLIISIVTENSWTVPFPWFILPLVCLRLLRGGFSQPQLMYIPVGVAFLAAAFDLKHVIDIQYDGKSLTSWNLLPIIMYICVSFYPKVVELYLKIAFIGAYVAPWQISWGSAFHAFAQPFSVPHSALIAIQTVISSIISAPLNPFLGSSFFTSSYVRPVKFWEKDYNTKRTDASTMRLSSQIDRGPMMDDSNLNAVFYEHLTRSLQKSLAGDLAMGRWATSVQPGDCFVLASFYLNSLVHIIEVGNGFVTFQLRGLFRGTYCHQREVEAITEDIRDGSGLCCCSPGSLPGFLSFNTSWNLRWLAWEVVSGKYIIDGYSISDNSAVNLLQVHELRRLLVTLYIKCIIYYTFKSNKLRLWMQSEAVAVWIKTVIEKQDYTDVDSIFCPTNDEDYDNGQSGISRASFNNVYATWMSYCSEKRKETAQDESEDLNESMAFCYLLSLVGRRSLGTASYNRHSSAAESFLYGLHSLFKGDFRITCQRDEWVFTDMDMLRCVVAPAVKMALKLHQDHFAQFEEFDEDEGLYTTIGDYQTKMFISHEQDPGWRNAILANTPSLLALRHIYDDGQDDYKIIMLNQMHLNMRVIKLNRECVRAFWAGQQQELIFLRNRNPERGSIQNARQVLRNMINSSADLPVGYPIYVSPLTTSHIESHSQIHKVFGPTFTFEGFRAFGQNVWDRLRNHFGPSGSTSAHQQQQQAQQAAQSAPGTSGIQITIPSGTSTSSGPGGPNPSSGPPIAPRAHFHVGPPTPRSDGDKETDEDQEMIVLTMTTPRQGRRLENSIVEMTKDGTARVSVLHPKCRPPLDDSIAAPVTLTAPPQTERERSIMSRPNLEKMLKTGQIIGGNQEMAIGSWVLIIDSEQIFKYLNEPLKSSGECLVVWPDELVQHMAGRSSWLFQPSRGMAGKIVYTWYPSHPLRNRRSHVGDHIHLLALPLMPNGLVPVAEKGLRCIAPQDISTLGLSGCTPQEQQEFQTRYIDALILSKIVTGTVSARTSFPKKPPIPPLSSRDRDRDREAGTSSSTTPTPAATS